MPTASPPGMKPTLSTKKARKDHKKPILQISLTGQSATHIPGTQIITGERMLMRTGSPTLIPPIRDRT